MKFALGLGAVTLISDVFRILFFTLDMIIYGLIPLIYQMIYSLYDIEVIFSGTQIDTMFNNFASSIYSFLAIFMFFRIAFSLITMIVDPSVIDDKENGAKKIVTNIMICLILIVVVPIVFDYAKIVQTKVFEERLIEKVVIGENYDFEENNLGEKLSRTVLRIFLSPNEGNNDSVSVNRYNEVFENDGPLAILLAHINSISPSGLINSIFDDQKGITFYSYSYTWPLSTIVGIYILWMFIQMMIDVAYRSIKFIALEILSPVAIVSYIDPGSSKKGVFSKWLNETVKTYIGLFIRIFVYSFASALLSFINVVDMNGNIIQNLFFILAIIAFIKTAPKFIDNLFGTSISKDSDTKFVGDMFKGVLGAAAVGTTALASSAVMSRGMTGVNRAKTIMGSTWSGVKKGYGSAQKNGLKGVIGSGIDSYKGVVKDTGTMDWWARQEHKDNSELSDRVEDARNLNKNPDVARFIKRDANGIEIRDRKGKVQTDLDAMNSFLQRNGYKHIDASDPNVRYQLDKVDKKSGELSQLEKEGYSSKGVKLQKELAELQQNAALDQMELQAINSSIAQKQNEVASISFNTALTRGLSVGAGGVYATEDRAIAAYRVDLETQLEIAKKSIADPNIDSASINKLQLNIDNIKNKLSNISLSDAYQEGFRVATKTDRVFATEQDAVITVANEIKTEIQELDVEQQNVNQRYQKNNGSVDKKKAEIKAHHQLNQDDARIIERMQKGDRIKGRDKD